MKHILLIFGLACGLAAVPALAADKPAKENTGKKPERAGKERADKDHCAEMMEHNKAPGGGGAADAAKKGCGMAMGNKKGMSEDHTGKGEGKGKGKGKRDEHKGHE